VHVTEEQVELDGAYPHGLCVLFIDVTLLQGRDAAARLPG
jgi:hypothetical protein